MEDLYADLDRHARQGALDRFPEFLERRFARRDESVDAVLCWDIFDYLAPASAGVRDITDLFAGLELFASVLLKSGVREVLFRKPGEV